MPQVHMHHLDDASQEAQCFRVTQIQATDKLHTWESPSYVLDGCQTALVQSDTSCLTHPTHSPAPQPIPLSKALRLPPHFPSLGISAFCPLFSDSIFLSGFFTSSTSLHGIHALCPIFTTFSSALGVSLWAPSATYFPFGPQFNFPTSMSHPQLSPASALFYHNNQLPKMLLTVPPSPKDLEPVPWPQSPLPGMFIRLIPALPSSQPVSRISLSYSHPGHLQSQTSCHLPLCSFCQLCAMTRGSQGQQ